MDAGIGRSTGGCFWARSAFVLLVAACGAGPAAAQEILSTSIVDLHQGSSLSSLAEGLGNGGFELAFGDPITFSRWYSTHWKELSVEFLTQTGDDSGILWGASTGERAEKYILYPGIRLGFIQQWHPRPNGVLSLQATTTLFGKLKELTCQADYGEELGGVQTVNCRLAADRPTPADTLKYLVNADPTRLRITLNYSVSF